MASAGRGCVTAEGRGDGFHVSVRVFDAFADGQDEEDQALPRVDAHHPHPRVALDQFRHLRVAAPQVGVDGLDVVVQTELPPEQRFDPRFVRRAMELHGAVCAAVLADVHDVITDHGAEPTLTWRSKPAMALPALQRVLEVERLIDG